MNHPIYHVTGFNLTGVYSLSVKFNDGTSQEVNLSDVLFGELYGPLRDPNLFRQVRVDPEIRTLVWPNGADFDPATLHDWPRMQPLFAERAKAWKQNHVVPILGRTSGSS